MATKICAITTPTLVNGMVMPNQPSRYWPTTPRRPSTRSRATPPTTGGSTSGRVTRARNRDRPGKRVRASSQARGTPNSSDSAVVAVAVSTDRRRACRTAVSVSRSGRADQGARTSRPTSGRSRNRPAIPAGTSSAQDIRRRVSRRTARRGRPPVRGSPGRGARSRRLNRPCELNRPCGPTARCSG